MHTPGSCACHLDPTSDTLEPCDLCSEATGMNDGVGWKIVLCPLHAAAPDLLATLTSLLSTVQGRYGYATTQDSWPEVPMAEAAIARATGEE